jgi:hypothetical protein
MFNFRNLSKKAIGFGALYIGIKWTLIIFAGTYLYQSGLWRNEYIYSLPLVALLGIGIFFLKKHLHKKRESAAPKT